MDPFSTKDLFKLDAKIVHHEDSWHGFRLDKKLQSDSLCLAEVEDVDIPNLRSKVLKLSLDDVSLESLDGSETTTSASDADKSAAIDAGSDSSEINVWDVGFLSEKQPRNGLLSWDRFQGYSHDTAGPKYLSEAGPPAFDAILSRQWSAEKQGQLKYIRPDQFRQAVLNVLVGRSSLIFQWKDDISSFETQLSGFTLHGYSPALIATFCKTLSICGSSFRAIQAFSSSSKVVSATVFAIQSSLLQILNGIEVDVQRHEMSSSTLVTLWDIGNTYNEIYQLMKAIVTITQSTQSEVRVVELVIKFVDEAWFSNPPLRRILTHLAERILQPALHDTCQRIGLSKTSARSNGESDWILSNLLPDYRNMFNEIVNCLRVGEHNGVQSDDQSAVIVKFVHQWSDLATIQHEADTVELKSQSTVKKFLTSIGPDTKLRKPAGSSCDNTENPFAISFQIFPEDGSGPLERTTTNPPLSSLVAEDLCQEDRLHAQPELAPAQMLGMSLTPFLKAVHRTCSYNILTSLFLQHNLIAHVDLLHAFHLMGDGNFTSRLSKALFDADEYSAEGRRKTGLTAGLRLEDRDVWPPASSELRLVLLGLLSESSSIRQSAELLECISFAIRELSEEDLERCRDVQSIHALDFLQLVYAAPNSMLELIFSTSALDKYDRIFRFLLVLLRLHAFTQTLVANLISRKSSAQPNNQHHRLCLEMHHFVSTLFDYALNVAIAVPFNKLSTYFRGVHQSLLADDYDHCMTLAGSVSKLQKAHEDMLDEVLAALLLRREQSKCFAAMCEVLSISLKFSGHDRAGVKHKDSSQYLNFTVAVDNWYRQVSAFLRASDDARLRVLDDLLERMDYSGYRQRLPERHEASK